MADFDGVIDPLAGWPDVPQISTEAALAGGPGGVLNAQAVALTARLKQLSETLGSINLNPPGDFPVVRPSLLLDFANAGVLDPRIKFSRASTATYVDAKGIVRTAAADEPRLSHDPETGEAHWLLEESATNLAFYSYYQDGDFWVGNSFYQLTENVGVAPDGSNTLSRISAPSGGQPYAGPGATTSVSYVAGRKYVSSCWFQFDPNAESNQVRLLMHGNVFGNSKIVLFNTRTGVVTAATGSFTPESWGYKRFPNNLVLVWQVNTAINTTASYAPLLWFNSAISAGEGVNFWGIDVKEGAFLSSHIPTRGEAVTRAADFGRVKIEEFLNAEEATLFVESDQDEFDTGINRYIAFLSTNETSAGTDYDGPLRRNKGIYINASAVGGSDTPTIIVPPGDVVKQRLAWTYRVGGEWSLSVNGETVTGTNVLPAARALPWLKFGTAGNVTVGVNKVRRVAIYPRSMTAAQLSTLTA